MADDAALVWGAVSLMPNASTTALPYKIEASSDGTNWGNPEAVVTAVQSRLQDGSLAVVDSYQNRQAAIYLRITSTTYDGLGAGEAALVAETRKTGYNTLSWTPSAALAVPSVFDVVYGTLNFDFDDFGETQLRRRFVATLECLPFPRSANEVIATAPLPPSGTATTVTVDDGTSATGWTGSPNAAAVVSGAVREAVGSTIVDDGNNVSVWSSTGTSSGSSTSTAAMSDGTATRVTWSAPPPPPQPSGTVTLVLTRTAAIGTSVQKYLAVDAYASAGVVSFQINGSAATAVASEAAPRGSYTRFWFLAPAATVNTVRVQTLAAADNSIRLSVDQIVQTDVAPTARSLSLTRTGTITMGATPYLTVDYLLSGTAGTNPVTVLLDGTAATPLATSTQTNGYTRAYFQPPGATVGTVAFQSALDPGWVGSGGASASIAVDQIARTDAPPASGTRRQLARTLPVAGTVRTQGRLAVEHATTALGETLVYVYKDDGSGYTPPLRPFRVAGGTLTPDTTLYSGGSDNLNTLLAFDIPAAGVPRGNYRLMARIQRASAGSVALTVKANTRINGTYVSVEQTIVTTVAVGTTYSIVDLGGLSLPLSLLANAGSAVVRVTIQDVAGTGTNLDEAWLFNLDIGTLTHVDCLTGTPVAGGPANRLWLDPATVTNDGQDAIYRGFAADRSDAFNPGDAIRAWTPPLFEPSSMRIFTACNALDVAATLKHFPRWLHNARAVA